MFNVASVVRETLDKSKLVVPAVARPLHHRGMGGEPRSSVECLSASAFSSSASLHSNEN